MKGGHGTTAISTERAHEALQRWEKEVGGRQKLADTLILGNLDPRQSHFVRLLTGSRYQDHTLLRLCTDAAVSPYEIMELYRKAAFAKGQTVAITKTAEAMPALIEELTAKAISHMEVCVRCKGLGFVTRRAKSEDEAPESIPCKVCDGTGQLFVAADEKAQQKLLNILQLGPKQTTVTAVKVDLNPHTDPGAFSTVVKDSDDAARAIDAEMITVDAADAADAPTDPRKEVPDVPPESGGRAAE